MSRLSLLLLLVALPLAAAAACVKPLPAGFPHRKHLTLGTAACGSGQGDCLSCVSCHQNVLADGPNEGGPSGDGTERCAACHAREDLPRLTRMSRPSNHPGLGRAILFSHQKHLAMPEIGGQCIDCHSGVVKEPAGSAFPPMAKCLECHSTDFYDSNCTLCHTRQDLQGLVPQTFLRHDANWMRRHAIAAVDAETMCQECHKQSECQDCHDLNQTLRVELRRPDAILTEFRHRADFLSRHAIEARLESAQCARCHSTQDCESCHRLRGVSALGLGGPSPHPPGWIGDNPASRDFHGREARRDILQCASCHDRGPATNCIDCHRVGARGGNPHPNGWRSVRSPQDQMCRYCHER